MRSAVAALLAISVLSYDSGAWAIGKEPAAPAKTPDVQLSDGKLAYQRGDYSLAVRTLTPLLYPSIALTSEDAVIEAHRILALSYLLQKQEPEAEEEATSILALRPAFQLDPIVDPPMAVAFFDGVRKKQDARLRAVSERQQKEIEARAKEDERRRRANAERIYLETTVEHHSRLLATIPFGVGQFQNGQRTKAALFLSGELVFGAVSLASYLALEQKGVYNSATRQTFYPASEVNTARALLGVQLSTGIAFWATLLWGIIDAHVLYKPEVVHTREVAAPKHAAATPVFRPLIAPAVGPRSAGLNVGGEF